VHPERYALVERMAKDVGASVPELLSDEKKVESIELTKYVSDEVGLPTLKDILVELRKPGRDPRAAFEAVAFRDDVTGPKDLREGMELDGVVTNVVAFGAFVDVGVHQDGLVHVSQLADRYVSDPNHVVTVGQRVKVRVVAVDLQRNRIALTMKSATADTRPTGGPPRDGRRSPSTAPQKTAVKVPPTPKPFTVPKPGDVAPNGMRFR
jgi:uncharacterized protein